ncbi:tetraacyldisaccharide 4'-kinase [Leptospira congkakensis]|uniref:Tetraacyldisaccharide 4'-kinase n=1 Tax=Leptospira congkakensis TaxID=2484932 RepID=A0A4Z1AC24_9LEPT|nr:tetraacyldisaccharide 4'-kinase [Leptospira congkakensis]TGL87821.1 tetraacyldisaccharide 4'-kinase [Leptospira congkakensis]TGL92598.1 tetraacyldisaccharide 4'-kinase [Leptospira congkakensis]TGL95972.1 tetraacyldisaccharide 4'-kinase [Leptospira congkakensis]
MKIFLYLFYPFSLLYRFLFWWQQRGTPSFRLPKVLVISVGNITLGGTGKTPFVQYLVKFFKEVYPSYAITILSRGYKAEKSNEGAILTNGLTPKLFGDEPSQHKEMFPDIQVIIGRNRKNAFLLYNQIQSQKHIVILDDGFQHKALHRDFDFVLLDANSPFGNGFTIPLGFLREPVSHIKRTNAILFTKITSKNKNGLEKYHSDLKKLDPSIPIFSSQFESSVSEVQFQQGLTLKPFLPKLNSKYFLVTGVGNPKHVYETAKSTLLSESIRTKFFPDHFEFNEDVLFSLANEILNDEIFVTTEKDWIKMRTNIGFLKELQKKNIIVLILLIQVSVNEEKELKSMLVGLVSTYESKIDPALET